MKRKVQIIKRPKAQSGLEIRVNPGMGFNANQLSWPVMAGEFSAPNIKAKKVLPPVDRNEANLEAEDGETVLTALTGGSIPEFYKIGGKRHSAGGTPLNLPADSFIYSRDNSMKIKDEAVQKMFGKTYKKGGYTPAELSKAYDINKFREILADPDSDDLQRKTAEMMITNFNLKLGGLALAQESIKGFPQGIPKVAMPYLEVSGMNPEEFTQTEGQPDDTDQADDTARYGGLPRAQVGNIPYSLQIQNMMEAQKRAEAASKRQDMTNYIMQHDEYTNQQNLDELRKMYDEMKGASTVSSSWDWIPFFDTKEEISNKFTERAKDLGMNPLDVQMMFEEENKPLPAPKLSDYKINVRKNNKTGKIEMVNAEGKVVGYGNAANYKPSDASKSKTTSEPAAKKSTLDFANMTDAELEAIANSTPED